MQNDSFDVTYRDTSLGTITKVGNQALFNLKSPWQGEVEVIWQGLNNEGVRDLGEIVLEQPMKLPADRVFAELWRELAARGLVLRKR